MQRVKILVFSLLAMVLLGGFGCQYIIGSSSHEGPEKDLPKLSVRPLDISGSGGFFKELKICAPMPDFPSEVMVYKVISPTITKEEVSAQAKKLGISGEVKEGLNGLGLTVLGIVSPEGSYSVDKETGSFDYTTKEFELQAFPLKTLLSDEEYKKLATEFLVAKGLLSENAVWRDVNRNNVVGNSAGERFPYMIEVRYGHKDLNGIRFGGVGPEITVVFGENGKITSAFSVWREVEPFKDYPIISLNEAVEQVKAGKATIYDAKPNDIGTIKEAKLIYQNEPKDYQQQYVIPHYMFVGTNSEGKKFAAFTRAIPETLLQVTPLSSPKVPQSTKHR